MMTKIQSWIAVASLVVGVLPAATADAASDSQIARSMVASLESRTTLAVLAFENASGDPNDEAFADGITDEIAAALSRVPGLTVAGRASVYRFRTGRDLAAIGKAFHSRYLVDGSVRKAANRLHLAAEVRQVDGAKPLWTMEYDSDLARIFDIQDDVAHRIAAALHQPVKASVKLVPNRTSDMIAYDEYLRAKPAIRARGAKPFADAAVLLDDAVRRAPDFAPALALLAFDEDLTPLYSQALRSAMPEAARQVVAAAVPKAERLAERAVERDPGSADAHVAFAYAEMVQGKLLKADGLFQKALSLNPNQADGLHGYSQLLAAYGRIKDSLLLRQKLQALEPFIVNYTADTAEIYWLDGQDEPAIRMLNPFRPNRTAELAQITASLGSYHDAAGFLREMNPANYAPGQLEAAARILDSAPAKAVPATLPRLGSLGFIYLYVGAPERVMEYYESNLQAGYFQPISSTWFWHSSYAPVRRLDRFKAFAKAIGFVEVWKARGWPDACHPAGTDDFACE